MSDVYVNLSICKKCSKSIRWYDFSVRCTLGREWSSVDGRVPIPDKCDKKLEQVLSVRKRIR
jgi:hypothetical protein